MKKDESSIIAVDNKKATSESQNVIVADVNDNTQNDASASVQFLKLANQFAIDGALIPPEKKMPIEDRVNKRNRLINARQQQNIEQIIQKTLSYHANSDIRHRTDHDWFSRYINLAQEVSNPTMQDLWAKILAGELVKPGSFSYKSLKIFRDMSIFDAKLFAKACSLAVQDSSKKHIRLISGAYQQPGLLNFFSKSRQAHINLSQYGLNFANLMALAENNLLYLQESELSFANKTEALNLNYNGINLKFSALKTNTSIQFYKFTPLGCELAQLISDKPNEDFLEVLKQQLSRLIDITN
ncbi:TIGR03899 family protein [Litorilituus lipolyticus]|uniref:TIGR03899 family protein n=1 Tax=Litorilituus lipolyticus TaxID=2491017 RepID=UPI00147868F6|nr:TIGR03899 family protein [Litorilituus lipolyticus]